MLINRKWFVAVLFIAGFFGQSMAQAQAVNGPLVTLINSGLYSYNRLERLSAVANQDTYNQLSSLCANGASAGCSTAQLQVFDNVRELVQSANELLGVGPTQYSLRVDYEGLGFALRWTAAEELSAPGSASGEFANTQIASVMSRITALRFGASGGAIASNNVGALGGSAGDGVPSGRIGVFVDGGFGYGKRHPTELEDAFVFDNKDFTLGADYRLTPQFVFGAMLGLNRQRIEFDSSQSVVSGNIKASGTGITLYGLYEWDGPYLDMALGFQRLSINSTRVINYPSFNILVDSVFATATGKTNSTNSDFSLDLGWPIPVNAFGIDPYVRFQYRNININGFAEKSVYSGGSRVGQTAAYDFSFAGQSLKSMDGSAGVKLRYNWTPGFGVVVPYIKAEVHHNFDTNPFVVSANYNGGVTGVAGFDIPSDTRVSTYQIYSGGMSMVLHHGWQVFAQYQATSGIKYLNQHVISGGVRGEF